MRILHLSDHYLPVLGGIETHLHELALRQAARGDDVSVLTSTPAQADGRRSGDAGPISVHRVRSIREGCKFDMSCYDVVQAHVSVVAPFTGPVVAVAARRGVPMVVTVHSLWAGLGPVSTIGAAVTGIRGAPVVWSAVSDVAARQLRARLPGNPGVVVVPNAVDVAPRLSTPVRGQDQPIRVVSTMRLARRKRPLHLIQIMRALRATTSRPVELVIVGDGPQRGRVERQIALADLDGSVHITGRLEASGVRDALVEADVYVAPAILESFGLAALEARCVGLPVIGRAGSGLSEFVTPDVDGWLCESDGAIVDQLARVVDDDTLRHRVSEHNRTHRSAHTWANALECNDAAYDRALSTHGSRPLPARAARR